MQVIWEKTDRVDAKGKLSPDSTHGLPKPPPDFRIVEEGTPGFSHDGEEVASAGDIETAVVGHAGYGLGRAVQEPRAA